MLQEQVIFKGLQRINCKLSVTENKKGTIIMIERTIVDINKIQHTQSYLDVVVKSF